MQTKKFKDYFNKKKTGLTLYESYFPPKIKTKDVTEYFNENYRLLLEAERSEDFVQVVIFTLEELTFQSSATNKLFAEGTGWKPVQGVSGLYYRTDPPRPENQGRREICLAYKKNLTTTPQWTWYDDGKRKDKWKFTKEPNNTVKGFAARFFDKDILFLEIYHGVINEKAEKDIFLD